MQRRPDPKPHPPGAPSTARRGLRVVKLSLVVLLATAVPQAAVAVFSGSAALLADTIHSAGDAATALPLGLAFLLSQLRPTKRFTFGLGRVEDLAGISVVLLMLASAVAAGYEAWQRLWQPRPVDQLWAVALVALVGFVGKETVALLRIRTGQAIGSATLVADGLHARLDGWTSLAVLLGAFGVRLGFAWADPLAGLTITLAILSMAWSTAKTVFTRTLDGVEPETIDAVRWAAYRVPGVLSVLEIRARWVGHRLHAELNIAVHPEISVAEGHAIVKEVHRQLQQHIPHFARATIHVDPAPEVGDQFHFRTN